MIVRISCITSLRLSELTWVWIIHKATLLTTQTRKRTIKKQRLEDDGLCRNFTVITPVKNYSSILYFKLEGIASKNWSDSPDCGRVTGPPNTHTQKKTNPKGVVFFWLLRTIMMPLYFLKKQVSLRFPEIFSIDLYILALRPLPFLREIPDIRLRAKAL